MKKTTTVRERLSSAALLAGHCAGMLDLVALPIWMGALIGRLQLDPQRAGALVTLFLAGQVVSSLFCAPRFNRLPKRPLATLGFLVAAAAFAAMTLAPAYPVLALLHLIGGVGAGCALSVTHGSIGRAANPHRLFALAQLSLSMLGIVVMGAGPKAIEVGGASAFFALLAGFIACVAVLAGLTFPNDRTTPGVAAAAPVPAAAPIPSQAWFAIVGISLLTLAQAMMFSFIERIGVDRYGNDAVVAVLIGVGVVNLLPGPLAALLQHRLRADRVALVGPLLHATAALLLTQQPGYGVYAVTAASFVAIVVFTHTFLFGLLARLDPTGRAVSATPAMMMIGSCAGPILAGTVVVRFGYGALGLAVACVGVLSALLFSRLQRVPPAAAVAAATVPAGH
jgi:predicted MFS family arabinose efflux permease